MEIQQFYYDNKIVKYFILATIIWGVVAVLVGILVALQLAFPAFNFGIEYTSFGRMRPLHTNAVIFAFGGSALFATSLYVVQRTCHVRLAFDKLGMRADKIAHALALPVIRPKSKKQTFRFHD